MFEVSGEEIQRLDDVQLRTLVALLAIAELNAKALSVSGVASCRWSAIRLPSSGQFLPRLIFPTVRAEQTFDGILPDRSSLPRNAARTLRL